MTDATWKEIYIEMTDRDRSDFLFPKPAKTTWQYKLLRFLQYFSDTT